jgi:hypothetical protein
VLRAIAAIVAVIPLLAIEPAAAQSTPAAGAVFAMIDDNEWCPGGSVYLDLESGAFMLYPRLARPACGDRKSSAGVEKGTLDVPTLRRLRAASAEARRVGLKREQCDLVISNGGPQAVVITAPGFSEATPDELGCWSKEATALYDKLFEAFGRQRRP